jgi:hypothetical protein
VSNNRYEAAFAVQAEKLCKLGARDKDLCDFFGVAEATLNNWKLKHPRFTECMRRGKAQADAEVAESLFRRATGYRHIAFKVMQYEGTAITKRYVEHYPPDTVACIYWLKNRRPDLWRDKTEIETTRKNVISGMTDAELAETLDAIRGARNGNSGGDAAKATGEPPSPLPPLH